MAALGTLTRRVQRLENLHCLRTEADLRRKLLQSLDEEQSKRELAEAAMIDDVELIDRLFQAGFTAETLPALSLAPIALIAWGSGFVTQQEKDSAMKSLGELEMSRNDVVMGVINDWLQTRPSPELLSLWADYTRAQDVQSSPSATRIEQDWMMRLMNDVALASGGFLGFGAICTGEKMILDRIEDVLSRSSETD